MNDQAWTKLVWLLLALVAVIGFIMATAPRAHADNGFIMCPDGREGVIGGNTSCEFAQNVRKEFFLLHQSRNFAAVSPITGRTYGMDCGGVIPAHFADGQTLNAIRCYGGEGAEVVIW